MDCNYMDIQAHIAHARILRSQAMGEIMATGLHRTKVAISGLLVRITTLRQGSSRRGTRTATT